MENLLNKIFRRDKPEIRTALSADGLKSIFKSHGIDIETIGFPHIETRHNVPTDSYTIIFEDVNIKPVVINGKISTIITGKYNCYATASYRDKAGDWKPGGLISYAFKIQEGELNLKRRN